MQRVLPLVLLAAAGHEVSSAPHSSSHVLCFGDNKVIRCPPSTGCCPGGCCENSGTWKAPENPHFFPSSLWLPIFLGIIISLVAFCIFLFCIGSIVKACLCRQACLVESQPQPEPLRATYPRAAAQGPVGVANPSAVASGPPPPYPASQYPIWDPPPPYETVVANPPARLPAVPSS